MKFDLKKIDEEIMRQFEKEIPNIKKWDKKVEAHFISIVVEEHLKQVRGYLGELETKIINKKIRIEEGEEIIAEGIKEIERLENDLGAGGSLSDFISVRAGYHACEAFQAEYLRRGGKVSWSYWFSREFRPHVVAWWRKRILRDQSIGELGRLRGRRRGY